MNLRQMLLDDVVRTAAFLVLYLLIIFLARFLKGVLRPYALREELTARDNPAIALTTCGYYLATTAIFVGAAMGPSQGLLLDLRAVAGYTVLGLGFLHVARWFNERAVLPRFCDATQLVQRNVGVGAVHCGASVATGLIAAGSVSGQGGGVATALVFFVLGQVALWLFSLIYARTSPYDIHAELEQRNTAAGVAFGGSLIALGILIMNGVAGDFVGWREDLTQFATSTGLAFLCLPLIRRFMDRLTVPGDSLGREIREDQNPAAGLLEATVAIGTALVLAQVL